MGNQSIFNHLLTGLLVGLLLPLIAMLIFHQASMGDKSLSEFVDRALRFHALTQLMSLSVLPNLAAFFISLRLNWLNATRGILLATMILGVMIFVLKIS